MRCLALLCCALLIGTSPANAQGVIILGPDLEPKGVTLRSFSADKVEAVDWQGNDITLKTSEVLRIFGGARAYNWQSADWVKATLRDGQVLVGSLVESGDDESIRLALSIGGEVEVSLDDLLSLATQREARAPAVEEDDVVLLATGETLAGFVETISSKGIGFVVGDADDPIDLPMERIRALSIANKPEPIDPDAGLIRVGLADDTLLLLRGVTLDAEQKTLGGAHTLAIEPAGLSIPMSKVARIEPMLGRYTLSALTAAPMELLAGGEIFGVAMPPRIKPNGTMRLHAPTTVGFELPSGASRVTLSAELALDDDPDLPPERRAMAGCELVVYDGDEAIGRVKLEPDATRQRLNLPIKTRDLRIEIKPGVNGPVLDRVRITDSEVLISR